MTRIGEKVRRRGNKVEKVVRVGVEGKGRRKGKCGEEDKKQEERGKVKEIGKGD